MTRDNAEARWEFRTWGDPGQALMALEARAARTGTESVRDHYLIAPHGHDGAPAPPPNVKIRRGTLEVKHLIDSEEAFQRWRPAWSAEEPWPGDILARLCGELVGPAPSPELNACAPALGSEQLVDRLRDSCGLISTVVVDKKRTHHRLGPVVAEHCEAFFDGGLARDSIAMEGTDLDALREVREELGLEGQANVAMHEAAAALGAPR